MAINVTQVRTWSRLSDNDGLVFQSEYARAYNNIKSIRSGLAKSANYTILATDFAGLIRMSNANAAVTGKAYSAASPTNISSVAHGLVTGDGVIVQSSSDQSEVGNLHYIVTKVDNDNFTLDNVDNSGGGAGTLNYIKDVVITLPAAAGETDQTYKVQKTDAATTGAIRVTDGTTSYILLDQLDSMLIKSDGTSWLRMQMEKRGGITNAEQIKEYVLTTPLDISARFSTIGGAFANFLIPELPQDTVSVTLMYNFNNNGDASTTVGIDVSTSTGTQVISLNAEHEPIGNFLTLRGNAEILTEQSGGIGNIIRAKRVVTTIISSLHILGYKVRA